MTNDKVRCIASIEGTWDWVARRKTDGSLVAPRWGHPHKDSLYCSTNRQPENFNYTSFDFKCWECAVREGWVW